MKTSEAIDQIATALAVAQSKMKAAIKTEANDAFKGKKYADLTSVWEACREALTTNGISAIQDVARPNGHVEVTTRLLHKSGQWLEFGPLAMPIERPNAHGVGSATSYARRYALSAAVGVVQDDDDGNEAAGVTTPAKPKAVSGARVPDPKPEAPQQVGEAALKEAAKMIRRELENAPDSKAVTEIKTHHAKTLQAIAASSAKLHNWTLEPASEKEAA